MNFLPVVQRELRVVSRKPMTYYSRCLAALLAISISFAIVFAGFSGAVRGGSCGQDVFYALSTIAYLFVCLDGAHMTCDTLSQEKREGTLGLLFLTDLKGYDVVAGKLVPYLHRSVYCLMATLPALCFSFVLGGVTAVDFFRMAVSLANALFFSASLGLLVSACSWNERRAMGLSFGVAVILTMGMPALGLTVSASQNAISPLFLIFGPAGAFIISMGTGVTKLPTEIFQLSFFVSQIMSWTFLSVASLILPLLRDSKITSRKVHFRFWHKEAPATLDATRQGRRSWWAAVLLPVFVAATLGLVACFHPVGWADPTLFVGIVLVLHLVLKLMVAERACRVLVQNRQNGELELLLTTPFDEDEILRGYLLGIKRELLPAVLAVLGLDLCFLVGGWYKIGLVEGLTWGFAFLVEIPWLGISLYSITWVGLYLGMTSRSSAIAVRRTILFVVITPWLVLACSVAFWGLVTLGSGMVPSMLLPGAVWFIVLVALCNLGFTGWAVNKLRDQFRFLAAHQVIPDQPRPRWGWKKRLRRFLLLDK